MNPISPQEDKTLLETRLKFVSGSGLSTSAILAKPSIPTDLCVILCHGFLSDKQSRSNRRLTELLLPQGIATFRFDWHGMGETQEYFPHMTLKQCEEQLDAAFQLLPKQGFTRLGLIGSSFGGLLSILAAPKQPSLMALGLKCPVIDFPETLRQEFGREAMERWKLSNHIPNIVGDGSPVPLHYGFYEECLTYDAYAVLPYIHVPTLVVHGEQDQLIPRAQIDRLLKTLNTKKELTLIEGAGHQFGRPDEFRLMTNYLANWMIQHLKCQ